MGLLVGGVDVAIFASDSWYQEEERWTFTLSCLLRGTAGRKGGEGANLFTDKKWLL